MPLMDNQILDRHFSDAHRPVVPEGLNTRAALLREPDRTLFQLLLAGNVSRRQIARVLQIPAGTITRRVRRLDNRLNDPLVIALSEPRCPLPVQHRQLGIEHFLQGQTVPELAELHQMRPSQVRDMLSFIRGWHKGLTTRWALTGATP